MFHSISRGIVRTTTRKPMAQALKVKDLVEHKPQLQQLPQLQQQQQPQPFNKNARVSWTMAKEERMDRVSWVNK